MEWDRKRWAGDEPTRMIGADFLLPGDCSCTSLGPLLFPFVWAPVGSFSHLLESGKRDCGHITHIEKHSGPDCDRREGCHPASSAGSSGAEGAVH